MIPLSRLKPRHITRMIERLQDIPARNLDHSKRKIKIFIRLAERWKAIRG